MKSLFSQNRCKYQNMPQTLYVILLNSVMVTLYRIVNKPCYLTVSAGREKTSIDPTIFPALVHNCLGHIMIACLVTIFLFHCSLSPLNFPVTKPMVYLPQTVMEPKAIAIEITSGLIIVFYNSPWRHIPSWH